MINATELFEKLVESGISFSINNYGSNPLGPHFEMEVRNRDIMQGETRSSRQRGIAIAFGWLGTTAAELYPDSEFAKWWRERT